MKGVYILQISDGLIGKLQQQRKSFRQESSTNSSISLLSSSVWPQITAQAAAMPCAVFFCELCHNRWYALCFVWQEKAVFRQETTGAFLFSVDGDDIMRFTDIHGTVGPFAELKLVYFWLFTSWRGIFLSLRKDGGPYKSLCGPRVRGSGL